MAISLKHNLKVKKGNIHPGTFYVNKTHIYSILVIVQGVKHGMKRNSPLSVFTFREELREWDPGGF